IAFLIIGGLIGSYFVIAAGITIAVILAFAILSIYFYSTKIVDSGLAEFFVAVKGSMIVIGTYFIQSNQISLESILAGIVVGVLSSLVLFIASFPDYHADKSKGRKTLVILMGKKFAAKIIWIFPSISFGTIVIGVFFEIFPIYVLIALVPLPLIINAGRGLKKNYDNSTLLLPFMSRTLMFSRIVGGLFVLGILIGTNF
ncbi:MAG: prenyltransferase, partial [Candidatus Nitrosomaritimum yanchengensis]